MIRAAIILGLFAAKPACADVWTFETPSENIQCSVGQEIDISDIACTIIERNGPPAAPRPSGCQSDWGHTFFMRDRGPVMMMCEPLNRNKDGFDRADYGVTGQFGGFTCLSTEKGLDCRNLDGHGFFLSRSRQTIY